MGIPRLLSIDLTYGCHNGRFEFPDHPGPVVILGANGAGKTTLMEALVLTLYGLDLRREPQRLQTRVPWQTEVCSATVVLADEKGESLSVERNFRSQEVVVRRVADGWEIFRGDGNPAGNNADASKYRRWLASRLGLEEREQYENTACVNQGQLIQTKLGEHLLLVAAGGHRDVATAKAEIEESYYDLTQEPLIEGDRRRMRGRLLEEAEQAVVELERRLADARASLMRAEPILHEQEQLRMEIATLDDEIARLQRALPILADRRVHKAERDGLNERIIRLEGLERDLKGALLGFDSAAQAREMVGDPATYPEDFRERLAVLEELWPRRAQFQQEVAACEAELARVGSPPLAMGMACSLGFALAGVALYLTGRTEMGITLAALGVAGVIVLAVWRQRVGQRWRTAISGVDEAARRLNDLQDKIQVRLRGIPDADKLNMLTAGDRRLRFEMSEKAQAGHEEARRRLADALARIDSELHEVILYDAVVNRELSPGETVAEPESTPEETVGVASIDEGATPESTPLSQTVRRRLGRINRMVSRERHALAAKDIELRRALSGPLALPENVPAEADSAEEGLRDRWGRRQEIDQRLEVLEQHLTEYGRAPENPLALEEELQRVRQRWAELARKADICRRAHALVRDAYEEFHTRDQERLLTCISNHLVSMTAGVLGPLEAPETLESVRVLSAGRALPLESPPLSYGEFHATLLAVRLGAADFLARTGVRPPFLVDEPFTHLDEERAESVWRLLDAIARDRQVIVATQDRLMLDALDIQPDIILTRQRTARTASSLAAT